MSTGPEPRLLGLVVHDSPRAWERAGFTLTRSDDHVSQVNTYVRLSDSFAIVFQQAPSTTPKNTSNAGWCWNGVAPDKTEIDGIPLHTLPLEDMLDSHSVSRDPNYHWNQCCGVDHVVVRSSCLSQSVQAFADIGLQPRRSTSSIYPGITQHFFWAGDAIVELIGSDRGSRTAQQNGLELAHQSSIWGIVPVVPNLEQLRESLGNNTILSKIRAAQQEGRDIVTLNTEGIGISLAMAFLTPHQKQGTSRL